MAVELNDRPMVAPAQSPAPAPPIVRAVRASSARPGSKLAARRGATEAEAMIALRRTTLSLFMMLHLVPIGVCSSSRDDALATFHRGIAWEVGTEIIRIRDTIAISIRIRHDRWNAGLPGLRLLRSEIQVG